MNQLFAQTNNFFAKYQPLRGSPTPLERFSSGFIRWRNNLMRLGIFGGSFDPIHWAHLLMAETAYEQLQLDRLLLIPAAQSPLKLDRPPIDSKHRSEMVRLAISGNPNFAVDDREIQRTGVSYTVETLRELKQADPHSELYLIIGADSLSDFARWQSPAEICSLATLAVAHRGGTAAPDFNVLKPYCLSEEHFARHQACVINMPIMELSSTDIRKRVNSGKSIRYRTPAAVAAYIASHNLYRSSL